MIPAWLLYIAVVLVGVTSCGLLIVRDWRWNITILGLQYVGVVLLVSPAWEIEMAATILVSGWMAGAVLGVAMSGTLGSRPEGTAYAPCSLSERLFSLIAAGLVVLVVFSAVNASETWLAQIHPSSRWGGFILIGMGLLHLGLSNQPFKVVVGLLTILSGFETLYAALETSTLVAGLLAGINLGLALVCAYLLAAPGMEEAL
jgi:hypothetical protein